MTQANIQPNVKMYCAVINSCGYAGRLDKALEVVEEMKKNSVRGNVILYTTLIHACKLSGDFEQALKSFEEMKQAGVQPNIITYNVSCPSHQRPLSVVEIFLDTRRVSYFEMRKGIPSP